MSELVDKLRQAGVEVRQNMSDPDEFTICCPFCVDEGFSQDEKFRFGFNVRYDKGHCFHCDYRTRQASNHLSRKLELGQINRSVSEPIVDGTRKRPEVMELPEGFELLTEVEEDNEILVPAVRYAKKRGITKYQMKKWEIGATAAGPFAYRIIFPVRFEGQLLGLVGRDWTGKQKIPHKTSVGLKSLWGINNWLKEGHTKRIILTEGIPKSLAVERATDYAECVGATMGCTFTYVQGSQLRGFKEVILFPDPKTSRDGVRGFLGVAEFLSPLYKVYMVWPWPEKQADEMKPEQIVQLLEGKRRFGENLAFEIRSKQLLETL